MPRYTPTTCLVIHHQIHLRVKDKSFIHPKSFIISKIRERNFVCIGLLMLSSKFHGYSMRYVEENSKCPTSYLRNHKSLRCPTLWAFKVITGNENLDLISSGSNPLVWPNKSQESGITFLQLLHILASQPEHCAISFMAHHLTAQCFAVDLFWVRVARLQAQTPVPRLHHGSVQIFFSCVASRLITDNTKMTPHSHSLRSIMPSDVCLLLVMLFVSCAFILCFCNSVFCLLWLWSLVCYVCLTPCLFYDHDSACCFGPGWKQFIYLFFLFFFLNKCGMNPALPRAMQVHCRLGVLESRSGVHQNCFQES